MRVAGIMSGTSLDGIDVAVVEITGRGWTQAIKTLAFRSFPYSDKVRKALLAVSNAVAHTGEVSRLNVLLAELYAEAVRKTWSESLDLVGCHGQTIFHEGVAVRYLGHLIASTLQIGDGCFLAERLGVPVVSDFRMRDMAAGGRGAPLVPFFDYLVYRHARRGRIALNIGGIANLTVIPASAQPSNLVAFDTGPGNMVMDQLTSHYSAGRQRYDRGGRMAARGTVDTRLLTRLCRHRYYRQPPPKTAGREQYGSTFVKEMLQAKLSPEDTMATATAFTAETIALAIERFGGNAHDLVVSGGGVHNQTLMQMLTRRLPSLEVQSSEKLGIHPDAKEAIAFAVFAHETWHHRPSNLPSATGADRAVVLGKLSSAGPALTARRPKASK